MSKSSLARPARDHVLVRVDQEGIEEPVGTFRSFEQGWSAGQEAVHADKDAAFSLYRGGRRVARFCHHRIASRTSSAMAWELLS